MFKAHKSQFRRNTVIDNKFGLVNNPVPVDGVYSEHVATIVENTIYGNSMSPDCPEDGGFCWRLDKKGLIVGAPDTTGK